MQALWTDYGDVTVQLYSPGDPGYDPYHPSHNYELITELHNGEAGPGAWLNRWYTVPAKNDDGTMGYDHTCPLSIDTFDYNRVQWVDSAYNSPYRPWHTSTEDPETWDFYYIGGGCHAYTQIPGDSASLTATYKKATQWRLDKPMFIKTSSTHNGSRIQSNAVVIMLEIAWAKRSKNSDGTDAGLVDWKYEYLHFLTPPVEKLAPESNSAERDNYDLLSYGQSLSTMTPSKPPSNDHEIQWINMHIYNAGTTGLYCPGITLWVL